MKRQLLVLALPLLLLTACGKEEVTVEKAIGTESFPVAMPVDGKVIDPDHGEEIWFAFGSLSGLEDTPANGVAHLHYFDDGTTIHTMQLNIAIANDGFFYEGWLVHPESGDFISTGAINSLFGDARHSLREEIEGDYREYTKVVVTLEPDDGNPDPAEHVAEGIVKETKRR